MLCTGVAAVLSEVLPLQRSYWLVLTVGIILKPDFGSVFARALQRAIGTVVGAVLGAAILAIVPYGPWLLLPFGVLAALLPFARARNFGLVATFLTPLVVLLIDLLTSRPAGGWPRPGWSIPCWPARWSSSSATRRGRRPGRCTCPGSSPRRCGRWPTTWTRR